MILGGQSPAQHAFSVSICRLGSANQFVICRAAKINNSMQNKQLRADENRANNTVIRKRAKAQIVVSIVKEVREGKWLHVPYAACGTQIHPQIAMVCSKVTARGAVARPAGCTLNIIPAGWC